MTPWCKQASGITWSNDYDAHEKITLVWTSLDGWYRTLKQWPYPNDDPEDDPFGVDRPGGWHGDELGVNKPGWMTWSNDPDDPYGSLKKSRGMTWRSGTNHLGVNNPGWMTWSQASKLSSRGFCSGAREPVFGCAAVHTLVMRRRILRHCCIGTF